MDRRDFIKLLGVAGANAAAFAAVSTYMEEALAQSTAIDDLLTASAPCVDGSLDDIEHVIFLMQENRSFDHYFGTLRGVRGFGDPRPLAQPNGTAVWEQVNGTKPKVKPYRLQKSGESSGSIFVEDPPHGYGDGLTAWNKGKMNQWIQAKKIVCMAHYNEEDLPLYFKLAKAFTVCDASFCSHNGATDPNRSFFYTGTALGRNANSFFSGNNNGATNWPSYPERLEALGVDWKFYQDGLTWTQDPFAGNYGDNTLEYFQQFRINTTSSIYKKNQTVNSVLRTSSATPSKFEQDVLDDKLPPVSWIVAPEAFTEHPHFPPHFGEYYLNEILRALAANPEVWRKTALIITYDENGGFFDHVPPPTPPLNTSQGLASPSIKIDALPANNFTFNSENSMNNPTNPTGMGIRVPTLMVSPWSVGGRVCSQVFDHTSCIRFVETWLRAKGKPVDANPFGQISSWRRAIAGDLTNTLDFKRAPGNDLKALASPPETATIFTEAQKAEARAKQSYKPDEAAAAVDANIVTATKQDTTRCDLLPVGYNFQTYVRFENATATSRFRWNFVNSGTLGVALAIYAYHRNDAPWFYSLEKTVDAANPIQLADTAAPANGIYRYAVHGPNGYLSEFTGDDSALVQRLAPEVVAINSLEDAAKIQFVFANWPSANGSLTAINAYTGETKTITPGTTSVEIATVDGWYDVAFVQPGAANYLRRHAGHLENGKVSKTDPAIGKLYDSQSRTYKSPVTT